MVDDDTIPVKIRSGYVYLGGWQPDRVTESGTTITAAAADRLLWALWENAWLIRHARDLAEIAQAYIDLGEHVLDGLQVWRTTAGQVPAIDDPARLVDRVVAYTDDPAAVEALGGAVTRPAWLRPRTVETVHEVGRLRVVAEVTVPPADEANDVVAAEVVEDET